MMYVQIIHDNIYALGFWINHIHQISHGKSKILFDRVTFPDLLALEGDVGGRAVFSKHKVEFMPWHDDILLLDVDKPEDYKRLVESE